jgi:hypothetical protein
MKRATAPPRMRSKVMEPSKRVTEIEITEERHERSEREQKHSQIEHGNYPSTASFVR